MSTFPYQIKFFWFLYILRPESKILSFNNAKYELLKQSRCYFAYFSGGSFEFLLGLAF